LHLQLFGHLSIVRFDGAAVSAAVDLGGRPGGLLAFLALAQGRFFSRHELIDALWADQGDATRVGTFNTTLWRLRRALQQPPLLHDVLVVCDRRGAVGLPANAPVRLDVAEFARLVEPGLAKPLEQLSAEDLQGLKQGVALYRDDMLAGFTDDWALRERELQRRRCLNALARLMHLAVLQQDLAAAIGWAQQILDRDPLREDIHRELMRLFLAGGQRALALRQFEQCRTVLKRELAIQPMRETLAVYQQIAEGAIGHEASALAAASAPQVAASADFALLDLVANARRHLALADAQLQHIVSIRE